LETLFLAISPLILEVGGVVTTMGGHLAHLPPENISQTHQLP
jgi:hypothetical protein